MTKHALKVPDHGRDHHPFGGDPIAMGQWHIVLFGNSEAVAAGVVDIHLPVPRGLHKKSVRDAALSCFTAGGSDCTLDIKNHNSGLTICTVTIAAGDTSSLPAPVTGMANQKVNRADRLIFEVTAAGGCSGLVLDLSIW